MPPLGVRQRESLLTLATPVCNRSHVIPTIREVAERAGTTVTTVSRVLNNSGYVRAEKRTAVLRAVEELGYVPNANARVLKTKRSKVIGVVTGELTNPYSAELASSVQAAASERGYTTFIASALDDATSTAALLSLQHQRVAGVIVATLPTAETDQLLARLASQHLPVVLVGRRLDHASVDSIAADYQRGGLLCAQHLLELGHRRIAFVGAELGEAERIGRLKGYLDALRDAGVSVRPDYVVGDSRAVAGPRYSTQITGYRGAQQLLRLPSRPTAIFARNDYTAIGVLQALREANVRTPEDVSVAGFDNIPLAALMTPTLTTVSQPTGEEGRMAAELLLERVERPESSLPRREVALQCNLIVRASTAPARVSR